ncbi:hypothetical protein N431DRAFT_544613 [Stipitochalara longipes BDJ]|nr:hypothetical protein N431DRAFT_544613 [Stipitochalara longipes BDJ]
MIIHRVSKWASLSLLLIAYARFVIGVAQPAGELIIAEDVPVDLQTETCLGPPESRITPAPILAHKVANFGHKRDGSVLCPGYSIVGNTYPYSDLWCGSGYTCISGGIGGPTSYFTCGIPGGTYIWRTACHNYPNTPAGCSCTGLSTSACICGADITCESTAPYCLPWVITDTQTYVQYQCAATPNLSVNIVRVSTTSTSTSRSTSTPTPTPTTAPETVPALPSSTPASKPGTSSTAFIPTQTSNRSTPNSTPTGINLAAVIAGTLGGVGSFAAGAIAIYEFLKRRRRAKTQREAEAVESTN